MENVIHSTFVIVSSLATVLVDKGTSQYPKCVLITSVLLCFPLLSGLLCMIWIASAWATVSCIQVGTSGAVQCLWVQETGGRKCWKRYRRCHQQQEGPTKFQWTYDVGFPACSMLGFWFYDTQEMEILKSGRFRKKRRACTIWTQQQTHPRCFH